MLSNRETVVSHFLPRAWEKQQNRYCYRGRPSAGGIALSSGGAIIFVGARAQAILPRGKHTSALLLLLTPFVLISSRGFIEKRTVPPTFHAAPIHPDKTDMPI